MEFLRQPEKFARHESSTAITLGRLGDSGSVDRELDLSDGLGVVRS
jgi:hypothetical protein